MPQDAYEPVAHEVQGAVAGLAKPVVDLPAAVTDVPERVVEAAKAPLQVVERAADALDEQVPLSDEPANRVLVDNARLVRWAAPVFALCVAVLVPWIIIAGLTLPNRQLSRNYNVAWSGYDVLLLTGLALTGWSALRRSRLLPLAASGTGALLAADAWFDVLTSPGGWSLTEAVAMSLFAELPLAALCWWLAWHSQDVAEQRLVLLMRSRGGESARGVGARGRHDASGQRTHDSERTG